MEVLPVKNAQGLKRGWVDWVGVVTFFLKSLLDSNVFNNCRSRFVLRILQIVTLSADNGVSRCSHIS